MVWVAMETVLYALECAALIPVLLAAVVWLGKRSPNKDFDASTDDRAWW
jgi:hypothetical protein